MLYKSNTSELEQTPKAMTEDYQMLRMKSPSEGTRKRSKSRNSRVVSGMNRTAMTPNADLLLHPDPRSSEPHQSFMIRGDAQGENLGLPEPLYVDDNCENKNPNLLRDPRLTALEDENRFLKEKMKK